MSQGDYHWQHEPCWYAVRKKGNWTGDRKQTTLWTIGSGGQDAETKHATQKPVECMRRPMLNNSSPGQAIYEPFLGSGTTLIAAQSCGRVCLWRRDRSALRRPRHSSLASLHGRKGPARKLMAYFSTLLRPTRERVRRPLDAWSPSETNEDEGANRQSWEASSECSRAEARTSGSGLSTGAQSARTARMDAPYCRARKAELDHSSRSRRPCDLLRCLRPLGRGDGANPEVWHHGEVADRLSDPVAVSLHCQQASRTYDAHCVRVRLYTSKPQPDIRSASRSAAAARARGR